MGREWRRWGNRSERRWDGSGGGGGNRSERWDGSGGGGGIGVRGGTGVE